MSLFCSPSSLSYEDTYNTLKYADRAKNIRLSVSVICLCEVIFQTFCLAQIQQFRTHWEVIHAGYMYFLNVLNRRDSGVQQQFFVGIFSDAV